MAPEPESTDHTGIGVSELARQVREVLVRFEGLAARLEAGQFVRTDNFEYYKELIRIELVQIRHLISNVADKTTMEDKFKDMGKDVDGKVSQRTHDELAKRVSELEDDKKYLTRILISFVVLMVLTGSVAIAKLTGGA